MTKNDTALLTIYNPIAADLTSVGQGSDNWIYDGIFQELDLATSEVLFEWHASDFYTIQDSYTVPGGKGLHKNDPWDFFHINSVDKDDAGNYYISARYTNSITCIDPSGNIRWRLGGKHNDFTDLSDGAATNFTCQHHAKFHAADNILTVFANDWCDETIPAGSYSRGLVIKLDTDAMTATLLTTLVSPSHIASKSQGSIQILPSGNYFVGWGHEAAYSEFDPDGNVLCDVHFAPEIWFHRGFVKAYRSYKGEWVGRPVWQPDVAMKGGKIYVSWNGATEVTDWRLQSASSDAEDVSVEWTDGKTFKKTGFESSIAVKPGATERYVKVVALDASGKELKASRIIDTQTSQVKVRHVQLGHSRALLIPLQVDGVYMTIDFDQSNTLTTIFIVFFGLGILFGLGYLIRSLFYRRIWRRGYTLLKSMDDSG
jgi:hypothetical protein